MLVAAALAGSITAASASVLGDLYIEAAAVTAQCTGRDFTTAEARELAAKFAADTGEQISTEEMLNRIAKTRQATAEGTNCRSAMAELHTYFVKTILLGDGAPVVGAQDVASANDGGRTVDR